ncbi:MAG TPA: antibiotic biosynthesis monooxygenase family protein [Thermoanaerobaculia bacterium]|jgi:heme-degrading monooxygenase HmoA
MQKRVRFALIGIAAALLLTVRAGAQCGGMGRSTLLLAQPSASSSPETASRTKSKRLIARLWHGRTLTAKADAYEKYLNETGVKKILATDGNHGVEVLRHTDGPKTDFVVISYWESLDAVKRFAGADYQKAVIMPRDAEFLIEVEPAVVHYEVVRAGGK